MFQLTRSQLEALGALNTTREIEQQPELWQETLANYLDNSQRIKAFFAKLPAGKLRVIFTGAGTSQYVGDTILPHLKRVGDEDRFDFQSVATTHLVSNPRDYLKSDYPTILVSFARSGNSPESTASVALAKQLVPDLYQITITCAAEGKLAKGAAGDDRNLLLLMPERSNDAGFAMTGSFTCMTLAGLLVFDQVDLKTKVSQVEAIIQMGQTVIESEKKLETFLKKPFERVVYLGSGPFAGLAREVQLKILELTAGQIATVYDSSLGFRHGPKSFVNEGTLVFTFVSNDPYTRRYDLDILKEVAKDKIAQLVCGIQVEQEYNAKGTSFSFDSKFAQLPDAYLALPYAVFGQTIALLTSIKVGNLPDTPSATGTVNRVVKGVTIYPLD